MAQYKSKIKEWDISKNLSANVRKEMLELAKKCVREEIRVLPLQRSSDGFIYPWRKLQRDDLKFNRNKSMWKYLRLPRTSDSLAAQHGAILREGTERERSLTVPALICEPEQLDDHRVNEILLKNLITFVPIAEIRPGHGSQGRVGTSILYDRVRQTYISLLNREKEHHLAKHRHDHLINMLLEGAFNELKGHVRQPSLPLLMNLVHFCQWNRWTETEALRVTFDKIFRDAVGLANKSLGQHHPFVEILRMCRLNSFWQARAWECMEDQAALLNSKDVPYNTTSFIRHQRMHFDAQNGALVKAAQTIEYHKKYEANNTEERSYWVRKMNLTLAKEGYERCGRFEEARLAYERAAGTSAVEHGEPVDEVAINSMRGLLKLFNRVPEWYDANMMIELAWTIFNSSSAVHGPFDNATLWDLSDLEKLLQDNNRKDELSTLVEIRESQRRAIKAMDC